MSDFEFLPGFEDVWRPPVRSRAVRPRAVLGKISGSASTRAKLARVVARTPEVMVKVTGRTRDPGHLAAHLSYITRNGELPATDRDGGDIRGAREVRDVAADWSALAALDGRRRASTPESVSMILSMPAGTDAARLLDAVVAFAAKQFGDRHDYLLVLHTDTGHPHVHLTVRAMGDSGERLNPKKADLEAWRQEFAEQLRLRGIAAEATPRRARGITRKAERTPVRKLRDRHEAGAGPLPEVRRFAYQEAGRAAFGGDTAPRPWETQLRTTQVRIRQTYVREAQILRSSADPQDRALADRVMAFVQSLPQPDSQRLALARELRKANRGIELAQAKPEGERSR
ncbi:relaxase/mobilization nuclease domain-containing protein [Phenylobacterium sp.]|uniref:relaxase/mobilization nuclease domain-containing protein n=1 Tax=Phenylobacterium sp. TaxID=1871053 RepID=UPI0035649947